MPYTCTKTYGSEQGLSCVFRQPLASSHCAKLHGYALGFSFTFACEERDVNGWVLDFGSLKPLKEWLARTFDHTVLLAADDPHLEAFRRLAAETATMDLRVFPAVGCENFARMAWVQANRLARLSTDGRARCVSCTVSEHGANSATYVWQPFEGGGASGHAAYPDTADVKPL